MINLSEGGMMGLKEVLFAGSVLGLGCVAPAAAMATITWDWSFSGEMGTFTTDGSAIGGVAAPGVYNFEDFSVTSSTLGEPIGSVSGSEYVATAFGSYPTYFLWNGASVNRWEDRGSNGFRWWTFGGGSDTYIFAQTAQNDNDPSQAVVFNGSTPQTLTQGTITVSVASGAVPEPATWALMLVGLGGLGAAIRSRRERAVQSA